MTSGRSLQGPASPGIMVAGEASGLSTFKPVPGPPVSSPSPHPSPSVKSQGTFRFLPALLQGLARLWTQRDY